MAFPTDSPFVKRLQDITQVARTLRSQAAGKIISLAAKDAVAGTVLDLRGRLIQAKATFDDAKTFSAAHADFVAYVQKQTAKPALDVAAEFTAMIAAVTAAIDWINTTLPVDGNDYLLVQKLAATGLEDRVFTPAQTAGLRTALQTIVDQIGA